VAQGIYAGAAEPAWVASVGSDTGTSPTLAEDFLPSAGGWAGMTQASQISWLLDTWDNSGYRLLLGVPMIPTTSTGAGVGTLATGATGAYNTYFQTLAENLVASNEGNAILRLGWEFNGGWYAWSVSNNTQAASFATYWQQIVTTMNAVPGANFQYVWNVSDGAGYGLDLADAYPGNAYVNYIGVDAYDQDCSSNPTPQNSWSNLLTGTAGLNWATSFAAANGKPVAIPEWGLEGTLNNGCTGMGDDPYYINQMSSWLVANHAAFESYFDVDASDGSHKLEDSTFTTSLAAFKEDF
jgi:hypothetical protein